MSLTTSSCELWESRFRDRRASVRACGCQVSLAFLLRVAPLFSPPRELFSFRIFASGTNWPALWAAPISCHRYRLLAAARRGLEA